MRDFIFKVTADITIPARTESEAVAKARMVTNSLEWSLNNVTITLAPDEPTKPLQNGQNKT